MKTPKMIQVMFMGKPLFKFYPHATKFQVMKYHTAMGIRLAAIFLFLSGSGVGIYNAGQASTTPVASYAQAEDKSTAMYQAKIEDLKNKVMDKLMDCERFTYKDEDGLVTYDPTDAQFTKSISTGTKQTVVDKGEMSYGLFQFKKSTVVYFMEMKTGKKITKKEALLIALDTDKAKELAKYVAFETKNKIGKDWYNCNVKYGLDAQVDIIKSME